VLLRHGARTLHADWSGASSLAALLAEIERLLARHRAADCLDLELLKNRREVAQADFAHELGNLQRGLRAIEVAFDYEAEATAAGRMIAENRSFARVLQRFCAARGLAEAAFWGGGGRVARFSVRAWRLHLSPPRLLRPYRAGSLVAAADMTPALLERMAAELGGWLVRNTAADGTQPYKYWPSRGEESTADNALRRFMATLWLGRWAQRCGEPDARAAAERNLRRNLAAYYVEDGGLGFIEHDGKAKLGAAAFAATALRESPLRVEIAAHLARLDAGIDAMWRPDGSFRTFHRPPERNDNQNFYPGEALLYWALRCRESGEEELRRRALLSLTWYRDWHLANRNPAFVPWHSQAAAELHRQTGEAWLRDWVFAMNDWLLALQQPAVPAPDFDGRFYDPRHPEYGPPHASSTGVYLEGLAEAFQLAEAAGDRARAERYAGAIRRGLRNLRQLQFRDDEDMAPYAQRARIEGALRTEVYDNTIRVDNVQHALGALLKLLPQPAFLATCPEVLESGGASAIVQSV